MSKKTLIVPAFRDNAIIKAVDDQRLKLGRVISLLQCLTVALEHGEDFQSGPYYCEISQMGVEMLAKVMDALDPINLERA